MISNFRHHFIKQPIVFLSIIVPMIYLGIISHIILLNNLSALTFSVIFIFIIFLVILPSFKVKKYKNGLKAKLYLEKLKNSLKDDLENNTLLKTEFEAIEKYCQKFEEKLQLIELLKNSPKPYEKQKINEEYEQVKEQFLNKLFEFEKGPTFQRVINKLIRKLSIEHSLDMLGSIMSMNPQKNTLNKTIQYPIEEYEKFSLFHKDNQEVFYRCFNIPSVILQISSKFFSKIYKNTINSVLTSALSNDSTYEINHESLCYEVALPIKEQRIYAQFILSFSYRNFYKILFIGKKKTFQSMLVLFEKHFPNTDFNYIINSNSDNNIKKQKNAAKEAELLNKFVNIDDDLSPVSNVLEISRSIYNYVSSSILFNNHEKKVNIFYISAYAPRSTSHGLKNAEKTNKLMTILESNINMIAFSKTAFIDEAVLNRFTFKIIDSLKFDHNIIEIRRSLFRASMFYSIDLQNWTYERFINKASYYCYRNNIKNYYSLCNKLEKLLKTISIDKIFE